MAISGLNNLLKRRSLTGERRFLLNANKLEIIAIGSASFIFFVRNE